MTKPYFPNEIILNSTENQFWLFFFPQFKFDKEEDRFVQGVKAYVQYRLGFYSVITIQLMSYSIINNHLHKIQNLTNHLSVSLRHQIQGGRTKRMSLSFPLYKLVNSIFTTVQMALVMSPLIHYQPSWILLPEPGNFRRALSPVQCSLFCDHYDILCLREGTKLISECELMP